MMFKSMFKNDSFRTIIDFSNEFSDIYTEIPPYTLDAKTGDFLNKTSEPIIKKTGKVNIQEKIQSYAQECDVYTILTKIASSGDTSLMNVKPVMFSDVVGLPDNINDFQAYMASKADVLKQFENNVADKILNATMSNADLQAYINQVVAAQILAQQQQQNNNNEVK